MKITTKFREACVKKIDEVFSQLVFGGDVHVSTEVELDESCFGKKRKNNKGETHKKQWVFGIVERDSNSIFLHIVDNRRKDTLVPLIQEHVSTAATIHHDDWPSYRRLHELGYKDLIVNHTKGFKSPEGACTNTIEGVWGVLKQRISRMHGVEFSKLDMYLKEYCFRYTFKSDIVAAMVSALV